VKSLSDKDLKELAITPGSDQCRALDELARRVRGNPENWRSPEGQPWLWTPICWPRAPNAMEIEWAFLKISEHYNDGDDKLLQEQSARITEIECVMDEESEDIACKYHNEVVAHLEERRLATVG